MGREAKCKSKTRELRAAVKAGEMTPAAATEEYRRFRRPWRVAGRTGTNWQPLGWRTRAALRARGIELKQEAA
jgi:hypothetical protein